MKKLVGIIVVALSVFVISCQKDQDLFVESELLSEKSAQIVVNEISVDNAMADLNFESDFFIGAEGMMMGFAGGMNGGMHGGGMNGGGMHGGGTYGGWMHGGGMDGSGTYGGENWTNGYSMHYMNGQYPGYSMHGNNAQNPDSLVMSYGMGTRLMNGRVFSGDMIIHRSENADGNGYTREITYNNFSVDSMMITGTSTMMITTDNVLGNIHTHSEDLLITLTNGTVVHRESEITRRWIEGGTTMTNQNDDLMEVTGQVKNTVSENGAEIIYRKEIITPLMKSSDCRYFGAGIVELTMGTEIVATLDYGGGECDDFAMLTENGNEPVQISLSTNDHCSDEYVENGMGFGNRNGMGGH